MGNCDAPDPFRAMPKRITIGQQYRK